MCAQTWTCHYCEFDRLERDFIYCPECGERVDWGKAWYLAHTEGED